MIAQHYGLTQGGSFRATGRPDGAVMRDSRSLVKSPLIAQSSR